MVSIEQQQAAIDKAVNSGIDVELKNLRKKVKEQKAEFKKLQRKLSEQEETLADDRRTAYRQGEDNVYREILHAFTGRSSSHKNMLHEEPRESAEGFLRELLNNKDHLPEALEEIEKLKKRLETWKTNEAQEALTWVMANEERFIHIDGGSRKLHPDADPSHVFSIEIGIDGKTLGQGQSDDFVEALINAFTTYKEFVL